MKFDACEYIRQLTIDLRDVDNPLTAALLVCGQSFYDRLAAEAETLLAQSQTHNDLVTLRDIARQNMSSATGPVLRGWIRLYTEASILHCLSSLTPTTTIQAINDLDFVLIFCGSASGRFDFVQSIIAAIQNAYFPPFSYNFTFPNHDRRCTQNLNFVNSHHQIPSLRVPPSLHSFRKNLAEKPFILRGYAHDWPALQHHPWSSAAYLRAVSGPGRVVPIEVGRDYRVEKWTQKLVSWDLFLSHLELDDQSPPTESSDTFYLAQHDLFMQFPALRQDVIVPDYVYSDLDPSLHPEYRPPNNGDRFVTNVWIGPRGTVSPAHKDPYFNLFAQIVGQKTVWLAPKKFETSMYPMISFKKQERPNQDMSNTSQVDVFSEANPGTYPDFLDEVVPHALSATLYPGDLLFLPVGWWHAMRSETTSISVSMWF